MRVKTIVLLFIGILLINSCLLAVSGNKKATQYFFVGTYTDAGSEGIYSFSLDPITGKLTDHGLAAKTNNPSFLALTSNGKFLLAVHETKDENGSNMGFIESFAVKNDENQLTTLGKVTSGGAHPCYVSVNQNGYVLAANYTGGNVALFRLDESGRLSGVLDVQQHYGSGPNKARQAEPHVHSAFFEPGSNRIFVPDLGIDQVSVYQVDKSGSKLVKTPFPAITMTPGSGPRHLAFHPTMKIVYVVNELACTVSTVSLNKDGSFTILETISALPNAYDQPNTCADIHISKDGRFLYASNRGLNSIVIFSVDPKNGKIIQIAQESTRGESPRNFTLSPDEDYLLVANQTTQDIVAFHRNASTGILQYADKIKALKPVCLLFRK
ncbi:MAG: lactonase family protein [Bacteroidia bacterium]|nr:lactonase family protein [Bacteroidia bacterium]